MMGGTALSVTGLSVRYGEIVALDGVDVDIGWGTVCGLVGINGSGKSSLFKAIMGSVRLTTGKVLIGDMTPDVARGEGRVGYMPQTELVDWAFPISVFDVVMMGRYGHMGSTRRASREDTEAVAGSLERVGLAGLADRQIGELSGGQRKRAFLARCLAQGATLVLLDEPFAGVDRGSQETISGVLRDLADTGATTLIATHDLNAIPGLCDEVVLIRNRIIQHSGVAEAMRPDALARAFGLEVSPETDPGEER